ncbi:MAG TPA: DUF4190 domain-containing protein [Solirubrobacter sp.]|nr:DUF4190 domain-containing protein [Solirubrobacter sp.]
MSIPGLPGDENPNPQWQLPRDEPRWTSQWAPEDPLAEPAPERVATPATGAASSSGAATPSWTGGPPRRVEGGAVAALIVAIIGLALCPLVGSVVALVLGLRAKRRIDASGGTLGGRGAAVAGIVLAWVGIVIYGLLAALVAIGIAVS